MGNWVIPPPISNLSMILNLLLGLVLSLILAWYYIHFGQSFTNRRKFALLLPVLTLTTAIVITIVKSSLALSLGLVGALSIVRFRTAIKDPEELILLFIAITIGLGMGAEQNVATVIGIIIVLGYMGISTLLGKPNKTSNLYLNILAEASSEQLLPDIHQCLLNHCISSDFRKMDSRDGLFQLTYYIDVRSTADLNNLVQDLHRQFNISELSFLKQEQ